MPLKLEQKKAIVAEINDIAKTSVSLVIANYRGLTAPQMTGLREKSRQEGVYLRVVRNTLTLRALEKTEFSCLIDKGVLLGPVMLAFSREELSAAARLMRDFAKEQEALEVTALAIGGKALPVGDLDAVASLPTKEEALASLMSVMKAPACKLVRTLNEVNAKLVRTMAAVAEKKAKEEK